MPRGLDKSKLYRNGQVKTAFKIDTHLNEIEFQRLIEDEFAELLNLNTPRPRFHVMKYVHGELVPPSLALGQSWSSENVLATCRQAHLYLVATHKLMLHEESSEVPRGQWTVDQYVTSSTENSTTELLNEHEGNAVLVESTDVVAYCSSMKTEEEEVTMIDNISLGSLQSIRQMFPNVPWDIITSCAEKATSVEELASQLCEYTEKGNEMQDNGLEEGRTSALEESNKTQSSPHEAFLKWQLTNASEERQKIKADRSKAMREAICLLKSKSLVLKNPPEVEFLGEDGIDADGPKREYLYLLTHAICHGEKNIIFFEGEDGHKVPIHNGEMVASQMFLYIGKLIVFCLLHGGQGLHGISPAIQKFIADADIHAATALLTLEDIADLHVREILEDIKAAKTPDAFQELNASDDVQTLFSAAGFTMKVLSPENKEQAFQEVLLYETIGKREKELVQLRKGLESCGFLCLLNEVQGCARFLFPEEYDISVDDLVNNLEAEVESDLSPNQQLSFGFLIDYIKEMGETEKTDVNLKSFLLFVSGQPVPPTQKISVGFLEGGKELPDADSCFLRLSIPTCHNDFATFKRRFDSVLSCQATGYGRF
eukprot:Seg5872.1 transcript_id=Seg5872.1/GoldUCD/mRNA.D3Y31 product="G2/M phase-specific E3 ubiquitin-protein ligase" protein_id=Seg5872.1/GoldUCD/D3Y31